MGIGSGLSSIMLSQSLTWIETDTSIPVLEQLLRDSIWSSDALFR